MAKQYLVARDTDGKVVGVRVTPRTYTHAVVGTWKATGRRSVVTWCGRPDLAAKACARAAYGYEAQVVVAVTVGTHADLAAFRPTYSQRCEYADGAVETRQSVHSMDYVDVVDLVDLGAAVEQVDTPTWWTGTGWMADPTALPGYVAREREQRAALRASVLERGHRNADGSITIWRGWTRFGYDASKEYAGAGFHGQVRPVPVAQVVVG